MSDQFARCSTNFSMSHLTPVNSGCCTTYARRKSLSAVEMHSATRYVAGHKDMSFFITVVLQYSSKLDRGDYVVKL